MAKPERNGIRAADLARCVVPRRAARGLPAMGMGAALVCLAGGAVPAQAAAPAAPTQFLQIGRTHHSVTFQWYDRSTNESRFVIRGGNPVTAHTVRAHAGTGYLTTTVKNLMLPGGTSAADKAARTFRISAVNADGAGAGGSVEVMLACSFTTFATPAWPRACWRPYSHKSAFNQPLPPTGTKDPASDKVIGYLRTRIPDLHLGQPPSQAPEDIRRRGTPNNVSTDRAGHIGEPTYYGRSSDPRYTLNCTYQPIPAWNPNPQHHCSIQGVKVRVPAGATSEGGVASPRQPPTASNAQLYAGPDAHLTIVDLAAKREYDLWKRHDVRVPPGGGPIDFAWGGWTRLDGTGLAADVHATNPSQYPQVSGNGTVAGFGSLAGRLRVEEFADAVRREERAGGRGLVHHALGIVVNCVNPKWTVPPARGHGAQACNSLVPDNQDSWDPVTKTWASDRLAPPLGARMRLALRPFQIDRMRTTLPAWKRVLARTLATYGGIVIDTGARRALLSFEHENGAQYDLYGVKPHPWWTFGQAANWNPYDPDKDPTLPPNPHPTPDNDALVGNMRGQADFDLFSHLELVNPKVTCSQLGQACPPRPAM